MNFFYRCQAAVIFQLLCVLVLQSGLLWVRFKIGKHVSVTRPYARGSHFLCKNPMPMFSKNTENQVTVGNWVRAE